MDTFNSRLKVHDDLRWKKRKKQRNKERKKDRHLRPNEK